MRYKAKIPRIIEAFQVTPETANKPDTWPEWFAERISKPTDSDFNANNILSKHLDNDLLIYKNGVGVRCFVIPEDRSYYYRDMRHPLGLQFMDKHSFEQLYEPFKEQKS